MSIEISCFDNIIGITQSECECFGDIGGSTSTSGLYLDGLVELTDVFNIIDCKNGNDVSEVMEKSITEAHKEFMADFNASLLNNVKMRRKRFKGFVGRPTYKTTHNLNADKIAGVRMYCAEVKGGFLKINKVGTLFSKTGTVKLHITNNRNDDIGYVVLNTSAKKHLVNHVTIDLPLYDGFDFPIEYYFYYEIDDNNMPLANELKCGTCGGFRPRFNTQTPYIGSPHAGLKNAWADWMMVGGLYMTNTNDFSDLTTVASNAMYGLTFDVEFGCVTDSVICDDDVLDFESNPIALAVAHAMRFKAGSIIIDKILKSGMINRQTLINREEKEATLAYYRSRYWEIMNYIIENLSFEFNDCFACKDKWEMKLGLIKA
jgi:hypothetical protein